MVLVGKGGVWRNKQMVIFRENVCKRDFLPSSTKMDFREKVLKENSYKERFMGNSSKSLLSFFNKNIEISKQSVIKQKYLNNTKSSACSFRG